MCSFMKSSGPDHCALLSMVIGTTTSHYMNITFIKSFGVKVGVAGVH